MSFKAQCPPPTPRGCGTFCIQELQVSHDGRWLEMTQSVPVTHWPQRHGSRNLKVRVAEPLTFPVCEPGLGTLRIQPRCYGNKAAIFTYRHFYSFPPFISGQ